VDPGAPIFVAGGGGFAGRAIARRLRALGFHNLVGERAAPDLGDAAAVDAFFAAARPRYVFLAAGRSAGIAANQRFPADLMLDNLRVQTSVLDAAWRFGVERLLLLASACIYPRECPQPMRPEQLLAGPLEPTSEPYALAKLAGLVLCRALARQHGRRFLSAIPASPFGPGDDFDPEQAHVVGALLRRLHEAKRRGAAELVVWGSGAARRDFLYVDDLADACVFLLREREDPEPINVTAGVDLSIAELAERIRKVVGFEGRLVFDPSRPDGAPRKTLDASPLREMGWRPATSLDEALAATYRWFTAHAAEA
jgi:GDP-L-fucose synthase